MATYYRASDYATIGRDCARHSLTEDRQHAEAYLGDGGLGGERLWKIDLEFAEDECLDLGDSIPEAMERLRETLEHIGVEVTSIHWAAYTWPYEILFSSESYWQEIAAAGYRAIRFPDEYPVGMIAVAYIGEDIEMEPAI